MASVLCENCGNIFTSTFDNFCDLCGVYVLCHSKMDDHTYCLPNEKEVKERFHQNENQCIDYENKITHLEKDNETLSQELKQLNEMLTLLKTSMLLKPTELEKL